MNEQEAMETLERLFSDSTNEDYPFTECFAEALTIALQALEKQIPIKPVRKLRSGMGWEYKDYYCSCGKFIGPEPHIKSILEKGEIPAKYCDDCGQRLDFEEV